MTEFDGIFVAGGHNGPTRASYLVGSGPSAALLPRRNTRDAMPYGHRSTRDAMPYGHRSTRAASTVTPGVPPDGTATRSGPAARNARRSAPWWTPVPAPDWDDVE
ncbi:hypothetical protein [Spongiactinospora sp. TRM90649]|uniref:hypothetical protein n=1 Tax=Spongiactinospora sp. TRM90649 TaxID=3031114 RepID=UPI0023F9EDC4|nr:hypothetical protein [Spongiactinospora sp. TRM90649]MDF5758717.1 hypothetical protein [Spongiactinospora sp. TRM90649]